ncbi:CPBP family intramembrane glutamic endopeptidase [Nocardioides sp. Bht2]|uniref:CPBP family intramembrane glutamic endopeptidase n=1 Tax=Nocardioides sp. Bht2 TaxID=3392297 RepID=UPI0039B5712A
MSRAQVVTVVTLALGTAGLAVLLRLEPGDPFFVAGGLAVALLWTAGALAAGPVRIADDGAGLRAVGLGAGAGAAAAGACLAAGFVVAQFSFLREPASEVLAHARADTALVVSMALINAIAEELFFRGALYDAVPQRLAIPLTTAAYLLTTLGSGVALLSVAAVFLGLITAWLRRVTGGVLAPVLTHLTWSVAMITLLPDVLALGR